MVRYEFNANRKNQAAQCDRGRNSTFPNLDTAQTHALACFASCDDGRASRYAAIIERSPKMTNRRLLISRNKREGFYAWKNPYNVPRSRHERTHVKARSLKRKVEQRRIMKRAAALCCTDFKFKIINLYPVIVPVKNSIKSIKIDSLSCLFIRPCVG